MAQDYIIRKNKALVVKKQSAIGTYNAPVSATDAVLIEDFRVNPNAQRLESSEATGSPDQGETEVTHLEPEITGSFKLRGSGSVTTPPHGAAILEAGGIAIATKTVLPSSGTTTAATGGASSFTVDRAVGNGSQWPSTADGCADLEGRPVELSTNPTTPRLAVIEECTIAGSIITVKLAETFSPLLDGTTTVKVLPGQMLDPVNVLADTPAISADAYEDGTVEKFKDCRAILDFSVDGAAHCLVNLTLKGNYHDDADAAVPTDINLAAIPNAAKWRRGRARLQKLALAATSFTIAPNMQDVRHRAPEETDGIDIPILTGRNVGGRLVVNKVKKATQDRLGKLRANEKMPFAALLDTGAAVGTRFILFVPNLKFLGLSNEDFSGLADHGLDYQAVRVPPRPTFRIFMF